MNASDHLKKAINFLLDEREAEAIEQLNSAIRLEPRLADAYLYRANAYKELRNFAMAFEDYAKALEFGARAIDAYLGIGICQSKRVDHTAALESFSKAIQLDSGSAEAYYWRGRTHYELKQYEDAIVDLSKCVELQKDHQDARAFLSLARGQLIPPEQPHRLQWNEYERTEFFDSAHSKAKTLLHEAFFWSADDYSPIGGDTGFDCREAVLDWRKSEPQNSSEDFLAWLFEDWGYDADTIIRVANEDFTYCIGDLHIEANVYDDTVIAVAFAQFMLDGYIDKRLKTLALRSVERQSRLEVLDFRSGEPDYAEARLKIKEALLSMPAQEI